MVEKKLMESHRAFAESRGNVLLVRKGNPKGIGGIADFISVSVAVKGISDRHLGPIGRK